MRLYVPQDVFIRQYGPYTYFHNQKTDASILFSDSELFAQELSRRSFDLEDIVTRIATACEVPRDAVRADYTEWILPLLRGAFLRDEGAKEASNFAATDASEPPETSNLATGAYGTLLKYFMTVPHLMYLQMDITQACSGRCIHCYLPEYSSNLLPYEQACHILDEFAGMGGLCVVVSGGECMLHPDFTRILEYARGKDLEIQVFSTLSICTDSIIEVMCRVNVAKVQVSLHGSVPEVHDAITRRQGSWASAISAIRKLKARGVPVSVACAVMKKNYRDVPGLGEFAKTLGVEFGTEERIMARLDHSVDNLACRLSDEELTEYLTAAYERLDDERGGKCAKGTGPECQGGHSGDEAFCDAGFDKLCVAPDGSYYVCAALQGYRLGNCLTDRIADIWAQSEHLRFFRSLRWKDVPECLRCPDVAYCSFCLVHNYNETGDVLRPPPYFCKLAKLSHEAFRSHERR